MGRASHPHLGGPHVEDSPRPRGTTWHSRGRTAAASRAKGGPPTRSGGDTPQQRPTTATTPYSIGPPHRHTPQSPQQQPHQTAPDPPARPQTQSGRDRKPAEAQAAQSSPDTAAGPQTESTQQEEAEASRVKQQPTRERLTWRTLPGHGHGTAKSRRRQTRSSEATEGGRSPQQPDQAGGRRKSNTSFLLLLVRSQSSLSETSWPSEDPPDHNALVQTHATRPERGDAADAQDAGSGAVRRREGKRTAEREEGTQPPAPTARQARRKRTWAARCRGSRRRGSPATRRGTQEGQGRRGAQALEEGTSQMAELMRSHTEENLGKRVPISTRGTAEQRGRSGWWGLKRSWRAA